MANIEVFQKFVQQKKDGKYVLRIETADGEPKISRQDLGKISELVCSQSRAAGGPFAVAKLENGQVAAIWEGHADVFADVEALKAANVLNQYELQLLEFGTHK